MKRKLASPLVVTIHASGGARRLTIHNQGDAQALRLLADASGGWVDPEQARVRGATLTRHVAALRRQFSVPIESETVPHGRWFFNRHRLLGSITIEAGQAQQVNGAVDALVGLAGNERV